eukprot:4576927-Prymnesium_polylepis.1
MSLEDPFATTVFSVPFDPRAQQLQDDAGVCAEAPAEGQPVPSIHQGVAAPAEDGVVSHRAAVEAEGAPVQVDVAEHRNGKRHRRDA